MNFDDDINVVDESGISYDDMNFVVENIRKMSVSDIVIKRNLTEKQINIILDNVKYHLLIAAQDNYDHLILVEKYIEENLTPQNKGD